MSLRAHFVSLPFIKYNTLCNNVEYTIQPPRLCLIGGEVLIAINCNLGPLKLPELAQGGDKRMLKNFMDFSLLIQSKICWSGAVTDYPVLCLPCITLYPLTRSPTNHRVSHWLSQLPLFLHLHHVFIPLDFHRFTIKSLMQFPHTAKAYRCIRRQLGFLRKWIRLDRSLRRWIFAL